MQDISLNDNNWSTNINQSATFHCIVILIIVRLLNTHELNKIEVISCRYIRILHERISNLDKKSYGEMLLYSFGNSTLFKVKSNYLMCTIIDNRNSDMKENMLFHPPNWILTFEVQKHNFENQISDVFVFRIVCRTSVVDLQYPPLQCIFLIRTQTFIRLIRTTFLSYVFT